MGWKSLPGLQIYLDFVKEHFSDEYVFRLSISILCCLDNVVSKGFLSHHLYMGMKYRYNQLITIITRIYDVYRLPS